MTLAWVLVFGLISWLGEPQRLNLVQPNAWTWLLLLSIGSDLSNVVDGVDRLRDRLR